MECLSPTCDNEIPPQVGTGRPRRYCVVCHPRRTKRDVSPAERASMVRSGKTANARQRAKRGKRNLGRGVVCGCGRDFLTVPIDEAHYCPYPRAA